MKVKIMFVLLILLINFSFVLSLEVNRDYVLNEINSCEKIIFDFQTNNFSTQYLEDVLVEAKILFKQVDYAEILRGNVNATLVERRNATMNLQIINWKNMSYEDVLIYTEKIKNRKEQGFLLYDKLTIAREQSISVESTDILNNAEIAFYAGRYNETEEYLKEFYDYLKAKKIEQSTINVLSKNTKNFFEKYWIETSLVLLCLVFIIYLFEKMRLRKNLKKRIQKMKDEKEALAKLMKKSQRDRFEKNKLSGLVYNIQIKKYNERLQEIENEIPLLEKELKKNKKFKKRN